MFHLNLCTVSEDSLLEHDHNAAVQNALHVAVKSHPLPQSPALTSTKKPSARGRTVRFEEGRNSCHEFEMCNAEECLEAWYLAEDYEDMKNNLAFTVFMMDAGCPEKVEDDERTTTRGLEKRTEDGAWLRYERKRYYYNAVLDEQERQWENDEEDYDIIAELARKVTLESAVEAREVGIKDELAVFGYTREEQESCDDTVTATTLSSSNRSGSSREDESWPSDDETEDIPL